MQTNESRKTVVVTAEGSEWDKFYEAIFELAKKAGVPVPQINGHAYEVSLSVTRAGMIVAAALAKGAAEYAD